MRLWYIPRHSLLSLKSSGKGIPVRCRLALWLTLGNSTSHWKNPRGSGFLLTSVVWHRTNFGSRTFKCSTSGERKTHSGEYDYPPPNKSLDTSGGSVFLNLI